ncbi:hypothetical protein CDD83_8179 [Cordyceps sp. RAO-2017]|nr:hypothetical protein CDD83_8179 [Cordyceps sp. RAO-2017]
MARLERQPPPPITTSSALRQPAALSEHRSIAGLVPSHTSMDKVIDSRFERLEKALSNLIDSVTKYHPSVAQAEELKAADAHLSEGLELVQTHQNNHVRIQRLRDGSAALDAQIRDTLTTLATTRRDVVGTHATKFPAEPSYPVAYDELLSYARRISKTTLPPAATLGGAASPSPETQTPVPDPSSSSQPPPPPSGPKTCRSRTVSPNRRRVARTSSSSPVGGTTCSRFTASVFHSALSVCGSGVTPRSATSDRYSATASPCWPPRMYDSSSWFIMKASGLISASQNAPHSLSILSPRPRTR